MVGCSVRGPGTGRGTAVLLLPGVPEASRRGIPREPSSCLGRHVPAPHLHFTGVSLSLLWPPCPSVLSSSSLSTLQTSQRVWALSTEADWRGPGEKLGFTGSWGSWANHEISQNLTLWCFPELLKILTLREKGQSLSAAHEGDTWSYLISLHSYHRLTCAL